MELSYDNNCSVNKALFPEKSVISISTKPVNMTNITLDGKNVRTTSTTDGRCIQPWNLHVSIFRA